MKAKEFPEDARPMPEDVDYGNAFEIASEHTRMEIATLSDFIEKFKKAKSSTSKKYYEKRTTKARDKCLKYLLYMYKLNPKKTESFLADAGVSNITEEATAAMKSAGSAT